MAAWALAHSQAMRSPRSRNVSRRAMGTFSSGRTYMFCLSRWRAVQAPVILEILDAIRIRNEIPLYLRIQNVTSHEFLHRAGVRDEIIFEPVEDLRKIRNLSFSVETIPIGIIDKLLCN